MSLQGNAETTAPVLRGRISGIETICIDAYAVAVRNGFEGTEEEWLASLAGNAERAEAANASAEEAAAAAVAAKTEAENFALSASYHADQAVQASIRAEAAASVGSGGVVYLEKDEANYNTIKALFDKGKAVIITYEGRCYNLQQVDGHSIMFRCVVGENHAYVLDYSSYGDVYDGYFPLLTPGSVNDTYNPDDSSPISGMGVAESKQWKQLFETREVTAEEVKVAGDDGITILSVGDSEKTLEAYNEILIKILVPRSDGVNTKKQGLVVLATAGASKSSEGLDSAILVKAQSDAISPKSFIEHNNDNVYVIYSAFAGDDFLFTQIMKNGYGTSNCYPGTQETTVCVDKFFRKSIKKYIHLTTMNEVFKFPAGTTMKVYGR